MAKLEQGEMTALKAENKETDKTKDSAAGAKDRDPKEVSSMETDTTSHETDTEDSDKEYSDTDDSVDSGVEAKKAKGGDPEDEWVDVLPGLGDECEYTEDMDEYETDSDSKDDFMDYKEYFENH